MLLAQLGDGGDIGDGQQRVGRGFHPDHPGARRDRGGDGVQLVQRDGRVVDVPLGEDLVDQPERAAVGVIRDHDVVTRPQHCAKGAVGGGHPRGEGPAVAAFLDGGQRGLQRGAGRVAGARVFESARNAPTPSWAKVLLA